MKNQIPTTADGTPVSDEVPYKPDVELRYGPASRARRAALS
jgi:hypothetical protein